MSLRTLILADPYNENHVSAIENFERENNLTPTVSSSLTLLATSMSKDEYQNAKREANEIDEYLFLSEKGTIKACGKLHSYKDVKSSYISFVEGKERARLIPLMTEYAFAALPAYEIYATSEITDKDLTKELLEYGYESLGFDNRKETFVKERQMVERLQNEERKGRQEK